MPGSERSVTPETQSGAGGSFAAKRPVAKLYALLTARERRYILILIPVSVAMALFQLLGIASIIPFLTLLSDPEIMFTDPRLATVYGWLGVDDAQQGLLIAAAASLVAVLLSNGAGIVTTWIEESLVARIHLGLQTRLVTLYLARPYAFFLGRNTSELSKNVLEEVSIVIAQVLMPMLLILTKGLVVLMIIALLVIADPLLAVALMALFGTLYGIVYAVVNRRLRSLGARRVSSAADRFQSIREAFGAIKEVKTIGIESSLHASGATRPPGSTSSATSS